MAEQPTRQGRILTFAALAIIVVAQVVVWYHDRRLNPGLIAAFGLSRPHARPPRPLTPSA